MILAAGKGTRLRPLTNNLPKCMVSLAGKPILEHNIQWLRGYGVTEFMINLHYLPDVVTEYFGDGSHFGVRIEYSFEADLLGTAGAVRQASEFVDGPIFIWYGDNLSNCHLDHLWELHSRRGATATIALHYRKDPTQSGIVDLGENSRITRFLEKPRPEQVFSHWVNAGIFVTEPEVLLSIPAKGACDFGRDVFPAMLEAGAPMFGYRMSDSESLWWIDTAEDLQRVQAEMAGSGAGLFAKNLA